MNGSNELKEIKKEIIEARGLIIKSNNLANSLSAEVRSIAKRQAGYERHLTWNSVGAYIIFVVVIFIGVQLAYNQRHAAFDTKLDAMKTRAEAAEKKLAQTKQVRKVDVKEQAENLMVLYELIHNAEREAAIQAYEELEKESLTKLEAKLLEDAIQDFRGDLSMSHYSRGLDRVREKKYAEAVEELQASLRFKGDAGHATAAKIQMANALRLLGKPREAIAVLQRLIEEHLDRDLSDDAYWHLALCHQEAHQRDEARSVLRALMRQYPDSQYFRAARIKAAEIQLHLYSSKSSSD